MAFMTVLTASHIRSTFIKLNPRKDWSFSDVNRKDTNSFTHGYHRYPAKFIPQIVRRLIEDFAPNGNEVICDPFGGCGTTLVEAKLSGRKSIGFDINPISKLITQAKATPINSNLINNARVEFVKNYEMNCKKKHLKKANRHYRINYWFDEVTVNELDKIYEAIKEIKNQKVRKFFMCAFSHNLKTCSRWLMKSIKPTIDKKKNISDPITSFLRHLDSMIKKNKLFYEELLLTGNITTSANMYRRDSTKRLPLDDSSINLVITSPPYVTSYEYADLHELSLIWFGDDNQTFKKWGKFSDNFRDFRRQFIGTSYKRQKTGQLNSSIAEQIIDDLSSSGRTLANDVENYFFDMKKAFREIYRILKINGKACIIIGNTTLKGVDILNAEVAVEQMTNLGFRKVDFIKREVPNKMISPWRDKETGKFTNLNNPRKIRAYEFEYVIVMEK